jgi:hypothetical protein
MRRAVPLLLVAAGCVAAFGLGKLSQDALPALGPAMAMAQDGPQLTVTRMEVAGLDAGEVRVADRQLLLIAVRAGGLSGYERAVIVVERINRMVREGVSPDSFTYRSYGDYAVVESRGRSVVMVTRDDARFAGSSVNDLARTWTSRLRVALGGSEVSAGGGQAGGDGGEWRPSEPYRDKYVPILSILQGIRIGVARVNGPTSQVNLVQAVGQFEIEFRDFLEIDVYVPISTREPGRSLSRIQSVGVTGLGDLRL